MLHCCVCVGGVGGGGGSLIIPQLLACLLPIAGDIDESVRAAAAAAAAADKMNEEAERSVRLQELRNRCVSCVAIVNRAHCNAAPQACWPAR
jgi:hypothetical protein